MRKKFVMFAALVIVAVIAYELISIAGTAKYKEDSSYCEVSQDCRCDGCGCNNQYNRRECILSEEGSKCQENGCQCINNKCVVHLIPESEIDTDKEAIDYAKKDADIKSFSENVDWSGVAYTAYFSQELGVWQVVAYAKDANDLDYQISFYPNGTITFKGSIPV